MASDAYINKVIQFQRGRLCVLHIKIHRVISAYNSTEASPVWGRASMCTQLKPNCIQLNKSAIKQKWTLKLNKEGRCKFFVLAVYRLSNRKHGYRRLRKEDVTSYTQRVFSNLNKIVYTN